jgi:hypothetical protein
MHLMHHTHTPHISSACCPVQDVTVQPLIVAQLILMMTACDQSLGINDHLLSVVISSVVSLAKSQSEGTSSSSDSFTLVQENAFCRAGSKRKKRLSVSMNVEECAAAVAGAAFSLSPVLYFPKFSFWTDAGVGVERGGEGLTILHACERDI